MTETAHVTTNNPDARDERVCVYHSGDHRDRQSEIHGAPARVDGVDDDDDRDAADRHDERADALIAGVLADDHCCCQHADEHDARLEYVEIDVLVRRDDDVAAAEIDERE